MEALKVICKNIKKTGDDTKGVLRIRKKNKKEGRGDNCVAKREDKTTKNKNKKKTVCNSTSKTKELRGRQKKKKERRGEFNEEGNKEEEKIRAQQNKKLNERIKRKTTLL